jgi:DNA-binding response OmpR family regulator
VGAKPVEWTEVATGAAVLFDVAEHVYDLVIADAETTKVGGMAIAHQLKDELASPPPVLLLIARSQDAWLGSWSGAERLLTYPADPFEVAAAVAEALGA